MMNRRGILRGALASAAVLAAGGGTGCAARELLRVAYHPWPGYAPLELARSLDWWEEAAVQALRTGSASASLQALREGRVAAAALTLDEVIGARHQGLPLRVMGILDISLGADQVLARPSHADPAQWRGARLGHENNAVGELMAVAWLQAAGLQASDVQMVHVPFDRHEAAWHQHEVDLLVTFEPTAGRLRHRGAVPIFDSAQLPAPWAIVDVLAVHARFATGRHTPQWRALLASVWAAQRHLNELPEDSRYRLAPWLDVPRDEVFALFAGLRLTGWRDNRDWLVGDEARLPAVADALRDLMRRNGLLSGTEVDTPLVWPDAIGTEAPT
ncbi:ABC transporter substrate-binding protein [uncultured Tepidimonas sp.]|uniref:ABC transporter substrate-binding protein n=1 Tax=uncultured Tepidimonas sp. TaxID=453579 RepID=UPI00261BDBA0|nr:ABC transporter substrate-binding protein [uncultured Tepidimonas sp.]